MINSPYINKHGTLNAKLADIVAENAPLWSVEYLLWQHDSDLSSSLSKYISLCKTSEKGLYNQYPTIQNSSEDYMSPDQLIAFVAAFKLSDSNSQIENIWKYLCKHFGTYDNTKPSKINFERMMQLSAILFCGVCAGKTWLKPLLSLVCIYSCATQRGETSGKLKAWVMFKVLKMKTTESICNWFIKRTPFKNWKGIFEEYFKEEENPIHTVIH